MARCGRRPLGGHAALLVALVLVLAGCVRTPTPTLTQVVRTTATRPAAKPDRGLARIVVRVQTTHIPGIGRCPPWGYPTPCIEPTPVTRPTAAATVQLVRADDSTRVVAEGTTDARGDVVFSVPPGRYWVVVPCGAIIFPYSSCGGADLMWLPDRSLALGWHAASASTSAQVEVTITITERGV